MKKMLLICCFFSVSPLLCQTTESPNVLLIYIDDLDFNQLGYYNSDILTPNIDSLIESSIEFKNAYVTSSVCTPSRFSLLTGQYASRATSLRSKYEDSELPNLVWNTHLREHQNVARMLKESNIYTGIVGKWHLGAFSPNSYTMDENPNDPVVQTKLLEDYKAIQTRIKAKGFDYADALYKGNPNEHGPAGVHFHNVEWITSKGIEFLDESVNSNKPFFLYYSSTVPHSPSPNESLRKEEYITQMAILDSSNILSSEMLTRQEIIDLVERQNKLNPYMSWLDEGVGALLRRLKKTEQYDNTMIIFMSDHQSRGKGTNYEGARVPLVIKPPNWNNKYVEVSQLVANIDILPTILSALDINEGNQDIDGNDLTPLLESNLQQEWRSHLLLEIGYSKAIKDNHGFKLIVNKFPSGLLDSAIANNSQLTHHGLFYPETKVKYNADSDFPHYFDHMQLYNLNTDSHEQVNLINNLDYSLNAHNLYNQMKIELSKLPHLYSEYIDNYFPLKSRIRNYQSNLKVFKVLDSISLIPADTLLFATSNTISDTLTFEFAILNSTLQALAIDNIVIPDWIDLVSVVDNNQEIVLTFVNKKKYVQMENSINITFSNNDKSLTYKAFVSTFPIISTINKPRSVVSYPNPVINELVVDIDQPYRAMIYGLNGSSIPINRKANRLNLGSLKKGIYVLHILDMKYNLLHAETIIKQ